MARGRDRDCGASDAGPDFPRRSSGAVKPLRRWVRYRFECGGLVPGTVLPLAVEVSEDWEAGRSYLTMKQA